MTHPDTDPAEPPAAPAEAPDVAPEIDDAELERLEADLATIEAAMDRVDAGEWQGLTRGQIEMEWPGYLEEGKRPPAYEPNGSMVGRVVGALSRIAERADGGDVLVVAHGGVVYALEESCGEHWQRIPNLGARWFEVVGGRVSAGPRVELLPDGTLPDLL